MTRRTGPRIGPALAAALVEAAVALVLIGGLASGGLRPEPAPPATAARMILPPETPPEVPPKPAVRSGGGAPARQAASPLPIPAFPLAAPRLPPAPVPSDAAGVTAGDSPLPGTGLGGLGAGTGEGVGDGTGDGGEPPRLVAGRIRDGDIPETLRDHPFRGTSAVGLTVAPDGRVSDCRIEVGSGIRLLDDLTCQLARQRLRFRPARTADGRAVAGEVGYDQDWIVTGRFDDDRDAD